MGENGIFSGSTALLSYFKNNIKQTFEFMDTKTFYYILYSFLVWDPFIMGFLIHLIIYHIWLKINNLTTYEHII